MASNIYRYFSMMGSILDIMPANDYRDTLGVDAPNDYLFENKEYYCSFDSLPSPEVLKIYESILPGYTERIFSLREKEQLFQHEKQKKALDGVINKDRRGQWMGFAIAMFILIIATVFAFKGEILFAGTLITIDLVGLVAVFVIGRKLNTT
ncbi:DUF2335 domain-containing protein [Xenorhabdus nematophila]|uniref:DUF2335 domain-containing protein n=1 Tax=Xenorhabdus nematophila (strain ATCC 19061 / DSM 3370 / CCUG 14189 / LMG 1036 / NCIMB 9965 / AN6) TaxID=406817 RepID=D3VDV6_XENNA|nr:DUF2335 domain-containing protein [Xenorhabdus nematophila]CEE91581.1 hypothetical protein XNA1_2220001 [Xenorhabdus nematophila str. Anatoliense]CEF32771.1 hypothetical protein XNW1_4510001 [Xenorhabdus nematophila str. Websteri]AYA40504.1 DUF2335 domain-containing protein [Xenorhabdus nematophila]KHD27312.1 hypothetical protein LH67_19250 [Xenorhabdus nematophila]MBA0019242.1 DUF2335 domain-containing protein [Xenorhabdus nematophila]